MKLNRLYKKAAKKVFESDDVCCTAIKDITGWINFNQPVSMFSEYFKPDDCLVGGRWFEDKKFLSYGVVIGKVPAKLTRKYKEHRTMALLLMAEIAKDEK